MKSSPAFHRLVALFTALFALLAFATPVRAASAAVIDVEVNEALVVF